MEQFDILIKNGTLLTLDAQNLIVNNGLLGIKGDNISYVGSRDDKKFEAKKTIDHQ